MSIQPEPIRCVACARILTTIDDVQFCVLCTRVFCPQHIVVRKGVSNCGGCEERRRILEQDGISDADNARIVSLLCRDLENTVGAGHEQVVEEAAARIRLFSDDPADFEQKSSTTFSRNCTTPSSTHRGPGARRIRIIRCGTPRPPGSAPRPGECRRTRDRLLWSGQTRRLTSRCTRPLSDPRT